MQIFSKYAISKKRMRHGEPYLRIGIVNILGTVGAKKHLITESLLH